MGQFIIGLMLAGFLFAAIGAALMVADWWDGHYFAAMGVLFLVMALLALGAHQALAHDEGQWGKSDPAVAEWFRTLMMPDAPTTSCCGESDAYWCDEIHVRSVPNADHSAASPRTFCTITDDRPDEPLRRPHINNGTEIEIPDYKLKWDRGNPTGHSIVFLSRSRYVYCFVQGGGA